MSSSQKQICKHKLKKRKKKKRLRLAICFPPSSTIALFRKWRVGKHFNIFLYKHLRPSNFNEVLNISFNERCFFLLVACVQQRNLALNPREESNLRPSRFDALPLRNRDFTVSQAITTFLCETRPENCKGQQCRKRYARKRNKNDGEFFARQ